MRIVLITLVFIALGCQKKITTLPDMGGFVTDSAVPVTVTQAHPVVQPPVMDPERQAVAVPIVDTVWFDFDSAVLKDVAKNALLQVAPALTGTVILYGGCSPEGSDIYNDSLGMRRARAVSDFLSQKMTGFVDIVCKSYGKTHLINANNLPINRRVEIFTEGK
jgi:outer membrane protein OmpA-like peptidoglycan-associated protein